MADSTKYQTVSLEKSTEIKDLERIAEEFKIDTKRGIIPAVIRALIREHDNKGVDNGE